MTAEQSSDAPGPSRRTAPPAPAQPLPFPVVGIGAAAGGLEAYEALLGHLPPKPHMAFVLLPHQDLDYGPDVRSRLQQATELPIVEATDSMEVEPNRVYLIPRKGTLRIEQGILRLSGGEASSGKPATLDHFLRSLAADQGEQAIGIVLSGTGTDGSLGLQRIKEYGGLALAQSPEEAAYDSMPRSALRSGVLDFSGPIAELAERLTRYFDPAHEIDLSVQADQLSDREADKLNQILQHLCLRTGHDFTQYKASTVLRRIRRRLHLNQTATLPAYLNLLRRSEDEVRALLNELLIFVTNFFRDPESFEILEQKVIPRLFEEKTPDDTVRVWVCGCATGEEAYTLAMLLQRQADRLAQPSPGIQVFATDLSERAITTARDGYYPEAIHEDVPENYLIRFFTRDGVGYRVKREIREKIVFAEHNLLSDPPFSRLDLLTCRNLLIYLKREAQKKVFQSFHYGLQTDGFLFLGSAESASMAEELFEPLVERHCIYRRRADSRKRSYLPTLQPSGSTPETPPQVSEPGPSSREPRDFKTIAESLLSDYAPPGVVINENHDLVYVLEEGARYLRLRPGEPSLNVLETIHPALQSSLRKALLRVFQEERETQSREVLIEEGKASWHVKLRARLIEAPELHRRLCLVLFEEEGLPEDAPAAPSTTRDVTPEREDADERVQELERELRHLRTRLQSTAEEYETSIEELSASNEELQSMNEELRSTTEELETSKEELQSMNEELITVNEELNSKNEELSRANNDLENLVVSTEIATLFLDRQLCIQRFTPQATALFNLIDSDRGRPLSHVTKKFECEHFLSDVEAVLEKLVPREYEVQTEDGLWYMARIRPYRTLEQDEIDGVVLTFFNITDRVEAEQALRSSRERFRWLNESGVIGMASFNSGGWITEANDAVLEMTGYSRRALEERRVHWHHLVPPEETEPILQAVTEAQATGYIEPREVVFLSRDDERICTLFGASLSDDRSEGVAFLLDITERKRLEEDLLANEERLRLAQRGASAGAWDWFVQEERVVWSDEYRTVYGVGPDLEPSYDNWLSLVHPDDREEADAYVRRFLEERREEFRTEFRIKHPEKGIRWLASLGRAQFDAAGRPERMIGITMDVTERKEAQQQLERLNELLERRVKERTATLEKKNKEVRRLAAALTLAEQRERQRISQMLHDHVQQLLYGLDMSQRQLRRRLGELPEDQQTDQEKILDQMDEILNEAIDYTRTLTVELSPPVLQGDEFEATLQWLARHMQERHGLSVQLEMRDRCEGFSEELRILLFQLVRELLFNTVKHAGVERAHLEARQDEDYITVEVSDAGTGFDPGILQGKAETGHGVGLTTMRERLQTLGGRLEIRSEPGEGTHVTIQVPTYFKD